MRLRLRLPSVVFAALAGAAATFGSPVPGLSAQGVDRVGPSLLDDVMPDVDSIQPASGSPLVRRAFKGGEIVGYVFLTSDLPPEEFGYSGPIETLVGMDTQGYITGVRVTEYHETYMRTRGDFLRRPGFQEQFSGKFVGDAFQVYGDVDGLSRVTISVRALSRGVRKTARMVAAEYLRDPERTDDPVGDVMALSWYRMRQLGVAERVEMPRAGSEDGPLGLSVIHVDSPELATYLVGGLYRYAEEEVEARGGADNVFLYVVDGRRPRLETASGWSIEQDGRTVALGDDDVEQLGAPWEGLLYGESTLMGILMVDDEMVDVARPMKLVFDQGEEGRHEITYTTQTALVAMAERRVAAEAEALRVAEAEAAAAAAAPDSSADVTVAASDPPPAASTSVAAAATTQARDADRFAFLDEEQAFGAQDPAQESLVDRMLREAQWGRVAWVLLCIALATLAFFTKRDTVRWASLASTFVVLGYVDGGFLSVSHITSAIWVGPSVFLGDFPLLIMVTFTLVALLFVGRIFCGYLCPFGALQDFIERLVPKRLQRELPRPVHRVALKAKYGILALVIVPPLFGSEASVYQYVEPFGTVFNFGPSPLLWSIAIGILLASAVVPRFYCRYACPLGAALAVGSLFTLRRIPRVEQCDYCKVCQQKCPTGAIDGPSVDFKECVRCNVCEIELIEKAGVCRHDMEEFRPRLVQLQARRAAAESAPAA